MRIATLAKCFLLIALTKVQSTTSQMLLEQGRPQAGPVGGFSPGETLSDLSRIIAAGKVTLTASAGHSFSEMQSANRVEWSQSHVTTEGTPPCVVSWDEDVVATANANKTHSSKSSERLYISLKDLMISDIAVMNLKNWANDDTVENDSTVPASSDGKYTGYVLVTKQTLQAVLIPKRTVSNPSDLKTIRKSVRLFFVSEKDADSAKKILTHAATLCGVKEGPS
jgi:hypothetical protein